MKPNTKLSTKQAKLFLNRFFWEKDEVDADELAEYLISTFPDLKAIGVNNLEKLIKGEVTKDKWTFEFTTLFKVFKIHPLDVLNVFSIVANGIQALRPRDPMYWDATKKNYSSIFLLPTILKNIDEKKLAETIHENLIKSIDSFLKKIENSKEESFNNYNFVIPNSIKNLINKNLDAVIVFYENEIKPNSKSFIENGFVATKESIYIINAFFTGIFSGLLNLIANIIELVGFILKYSLNSKTRVTVLEEIENAVEALFTNTKEVLNKIWEQLKKIIRDIDEYLTIETKYEAAFKVGEAIFEITEYFVALLKVVKSKKVTNLLQQLQKGSGKETIEKEVKTKLDEINKSIDKTVFVDKKIDRYAEKYKGITNYPRLEKADIKQVLKLFGKHGEKLFKSTEKEFLTLFNNAKSGNWLRQRQLLSGMSHSKYPNIISFKTNFPEKELKKVIDNLGIDRFKVTSVEQIKKIYNHFGEKLHPIIENRIAEHIDKFKTLNLSEKVISSTGGLPGVHAEIRALNDLLFKLEKKGIVIDNAFFNNVLGYNKKFVKEEVMVRCADCYYISADVKMISLN